MKPQAAVLTGDLVGSTKATAEAVQAAMDQIEATASELPEITSFARFRGDGWQVYMEKPGLALATSLLIFARLRAAAGLESRIAIGLGEANLSSFKNVLTARSIHGANGPAFVSSGRALDDMRKEQRLTLAGEGVDPLHRRLIAIIDDKVSHWSVEQSEAMAIALAPGVPLTQQEMADRLGITRQAVASRLRAADFRQINAAAIDFLYHFGEDH